MEVFIFDWWWTSHQPPAHKGLRILRLCLMPSKKMNENPQSNIAWEDSSKVHQNTALWTELMVSWWNSSGTSSQNSPHCSSATKSKSSCVKWLIQQKSLDGSSSCRRTTTSHWDLRTTRKRVKCSTLFSLCKKIRSRTMVILRAWIREKWCSFSEDTPQGEWDKIAEKMTLTLAESGHPVFRAKSPLCRGVLKSKGGGKLSIHYCADLATITTFFARLLL